MHEIIDFDCEEIENDWIISANGNFCNIIEPVISAVEFILFQTAFYSNALSSILSKS